MAKTINYEALRARHADTRPLEHLTDEELACLEGDAQDAPLGIPGALRDLSFLARLELGARHA